MATKVDVMASRIGPFTLWLVDRFGPNRDTIKSYSWTGDGSVDPPCKIGCTVPLSGLHKFKSWLCSLSLSELFYPTGNFHGSFIIWLVIISCARGTRNPFDWFRCNFKCLEEIKSTTSLHERAANDKKQWIFQGWILLTFKIYLNKKIKRKYFAF